MPVFTLTGADLITERLVLRPWPAGDLAAVRSGERRDGWADDFPAEGDRVIAGVIAGQPDLIGAYGHRQIAERESGLVIGSIGLFWPPADGIVELGYGIVPSRRRRGYASEATLAMVEFALTAPEIDVVRATVELANVASVRVLEKAGLHRTGGDEATAEFRSTG
ncbi:GNAT family N-acetyltransferase [Nonomuraea sp. SBT364]|uniref:GNAT family N-acetyltransferase n=1 Tax=Nonomuraea sp. SBT364 TaxID=1580530 RepID=UPI00066ABE36|nr:GNAT family N-acetyltransferase [Nonomuraea sp. SBT364]